MIFQTLNPTMALIAKESTYDMDVGRLPSRFEAKTWLFNLAMAEA